MHEATDVAGAAGRGIGLAAPTAVAAPAAAAASGSETFKGTIVTSGVSGSRTVITRAVVTKGMVSGAGRIVEVPNLPADLDTVSRDALVFASGSIHIVSANMDFSVFVDPSSCVPTVTIQPTREFAGDIGQFAAATGRFTGTVTGPAVLARNPDGNCSSAQDPLHEVDMITATGTLSF
jgi:hypothetical protein